MTLAEQFRQEGKQEGLLEGLQKGEQKGKLEGKLEASRAIAMKLFGQGMSIDQIALITGLSIQEIEEIKNSTAH